MSQENVEVVKRAVAAVNDRDIDSYLACCTADVRMENPVAPIEGAYEGADGIRRFFADVLDTAPDFRITIERLESIGTDRVLGFMRLNLSGRASGIRLGSDIPSAKRLRPRPWQDQAHPHLSRSPGGPRSRGVVGARRSRRVLSPF
jgi:hypothetical protein